MADMKEQKAAVMPYLQRAQEIQEADPKVAYYCRLYAVEQPRSVSPRSANPSATARLL
ncbi:hypothetical protein TSOC_015180 [Tetrabaena socialis]|uniref:Vta1/callose synthase N-terminal domain-containing protein n=1 Tax=Tetrabaena socialis TaxID=47790 RepID=A0A2J7ZFK2_9CHLO|nr:hypothetical protein TSOC_015180 [Tetrabaena socialis]|eukprot:PNG99050.1 hypothetical protein TSOC_015180 [Tetrabaena socialis]